MHSEWSPGQPYQPGDSFKPGLWQGCKPYNEVNSVNLDFSPGLWPSPADKLQSKENMQSNGSFRPDKVLDLYPQFSHWKSEDDHTLSPYLDDRQYQHAIPAASSAPSSELQTNHTTDEETAHDFQLIENLEVPATTTLTRSDSAHALGISIDPEMLPDIDALTDPFELPAQLRDTAQQPAAPQPQQPHSSYPAGQPREQHHHDTQSHQPYGNTSPSVASGLLNTGATASSGPASTASDDSGNPNLKAGRAAAKQTTPDLFDDLHLAYNQSGSLPLLDVDVDALTDQQAAYMLDENQELWDLMQQDEVAELDTSAALEGLDLASSIPPGAHGMSADTEQPYKPAASAATGVTEQGTNRRSSVSELSELELMATMGKRKGKGGRQPAMDPRLDPNVDPKRAKRILANRLSAARSKMKQKSHVEALRRQITALEAQKKELKGGMAKAKASCELKANENEALKAQIKVLEERCTQQGLMTSHLMERCSGNMRFRPPQNAKVYHPSTMQAPYSDAAAAERKPRGSLPPSSRSAKSREGLTRSAQQSQRAQPRHELMPAVKAEANADGGVQHDQYDQGPLKTWGSTGKRQPARPRSKA